MADNVEITPGTGANIATDEILGVKYPRSKMVLGDDGVNDGDVSSSNPVPMVIPPTSFLTDAFYRHRISAPTTVFSSKLLFDKRPLYWSEQITNGSGNATSTHSTTHSCVDMFVDNGDTIIRQSKRRFNYQAGKSQLIMMTGNFNGNVAGVTKRIGYFDANAGLFFELDGTDANVVVRKTGFDTKYARNTWDDKLDGTGASGVTLDFTKGQILFIDFEWLGVGSVGFGFIVDGVPIYAKRVHHANINDNVYMQTPNLPIRYEISSSLNTSTLKQICSTVISEGGEQDKEIGDTFSVSNINSPLTSALTGNDYAVLGIRLKNTHLGATILPTVLSVLPSSNDLFGWAISLNPVVAGTFTYSDLDDSCVQTATGTSSNTISDLGTVLFEGFANQHFPSSSVAIDSFLRLGSEIDGTRDTLVLSIHPITNNITVYGSLDWKELL